MWVGALKSMLKIVLKIFSIKILKVFCYTMTYLFFVSYIKQGRSIKRVVGISTLVLRTWNTPLARGPWFKSNLKKQGVSVSNSQNNLISIKIAKIKYLYAFFSLNIIAMSLYKYVPGIWMRKNCGNHLNLCWPNFSWFCFVIYLNHIILQCIYLFQINLKPI